MAGERPNQQIEELMKLNPEHTFPTLNDYGVYIWNSHVIVTYLVGKYGKDDSLYPKDLVLRAKIDERLHFDNGMLFTRLRHFLVSRILLLLLFCLSVCLSYTLQPQEVGSMG